MAEPLHEGVETDGRARPLAGALLLGAGVAMLVGAGLLLWSHRGAAVFTDMLSAAIAWCF